MKSKELVACMGSAKGIKAKKPVKNPMHWWLYIPTVAIGGCQMDAKKTSL
jgi:hypothetical protein